MSDSEELLSVRDLRVHFGAPSRPVRAVDGISLALARGEAAALVGESGSGKSVTALALARLVPSPPARYVSGEVLYRGRDVLRMSSRDVRGLRGREIAYVFQEPAGSLNPVVRLGPQIGEVLQRHRPGVERRREIRRLLELVGLEDAARVADAYPHELSGGMQQRAMIAMALAGEPKLLVADEPTTALDVTVQAQIVDLLVRLRHELGMALLLITHNLGLVARTAGRVHVVYAGQVVESGRAEDILTTPRHPYTQALLRAVPRLEGGSGRLEGIAGSVPPAHAWPSGCRFHPRCPARQQRCVEEQPTWDDLPGAAGVRCHFWSSLPKASAGASR